MVDFLSQSLHFRVVIHNQRRLITRWGFSVRVGYSYCGLNLLTSGLIASIGGVIIIAKVRGVIINYHCLIILVVFVSKKFHS